MTVSKEVQAAVDKIRRQSDLIASMRAADDVRDKQLADLQAKVAEHPSLSDEDKAALQGAVDDIRATNDALGAAVPANTDSPAATPDNPKNAPIAPVGDDNHPTEPLTSGDVLDRNGPANHPAGGTVAPMPTSAFDPAAGVSVGDAQRAVPAIETPGGFVIAGGGAVQRAPGSDPTSPSSSVTVPDAAVEAATASVDAPAVAPDALDPDGQPATGGTPEPSSTPDMGSNPSPVDENKPNAPAA